MFLQFSHEEINEFAMGEFYVKNTGKPFEVTDALGQALLKSTHPVDDESPVEALGRTLLDAKHPLSGAWVPVFVRTVKGVEAEELTETNLKKKSKPALLKIAEELKADATDDNNIPEIIAKILEKTGE